MNPSSSQPHRHPPTHTTITTHHLLQEGVPEAHYEVRVKRRQHLRLADALLLLLFTCACM